MRIKKTLTSFVCLFMVVSGAQAQPSEEVSREAIEELRDSMPDSPGTGAFPAMKEVDPALPDQVVYRPADLAALGDTKLGVYAFGNGGCTDDAALAHQHLLEVASHGYLVIAPGGIYSGPGASPRATPQAQGMDAVATTPAQLGQAVDWALAENLRADSAYFGKIDPAAVAVSGYSCGGIQALLNAKDARVATVVIMNSGLFLDQPTRMAGMEEGKERLLDLHTPTLYILGGSTDIAYVNGMDDFAKIDHVPIAAANIEKGHGGTYWEPNGGAAAQVAVSWLQWQLRGDSSAGEMFLGEDCGLCQNPEWSFVKKRLD